MLRITVTGDWWPILPHVQRLRLTVGRALGLRYRQKLDHLLVRGARSTASAAVVGMPGHAHLPGSDHVPVAVELIV